MGIFGSSVPLDDDFANVLANGEGYIRRTLARNQENIRDALGDGEQVTAIAVENYPPGDAVVVTDQRLLVMRKGGRSVARISDATQLNGVGCAQADQGVWTVIVKGPELAFRFARSETAYSLADAVGRLITDRRDGQRAISTLYPQYFLDLLAETGVPATPTNVTRLIERVFVMVSGQADAYFQQLDDPGARAEFHRRFAEGGPPERVLYVVDDMVDWLWGWHPGCRAALQELFPKIREGLLQPHSFLRTAGDEIVPWSEWTR